MTKKHEPVDPRAEEHEEAYYRRTIWEPKAQQANAARDVIQCAVTAYEMRESVHDLDFLTYLWDAVRRYQQHVEGRTSQ